MKSLWSYITYLTAYLTGSSIDQDISQQPLLGPHDTSIAAVQNEINVVVAVAPTVSTSLSAHRVDISAWPTFTPPTRKRQWAGSDFECEYPKMVGWEPCASNNRSCWLKEVNGEGIFDIGTDYEKYRPQGMVREYTLVVEDGQWNADGFWAKNAKLINGTYPGPLIQACWGDTLRVKVINKLAHNGTAIHWHGIRQNQTMHMDGVPGITQCPIAPHDYYVYEFETTQYGDSWYHSHYSVQYADGMLGPITIHGPTTAQWDEPKAPILMSDWFHNSAFQVIHDKVAGYPTIVLNGTGDISKHEFVYKDKNGDDVKDPDHPNEKPPKYLKYKVLPNAPIPAQYQLHVQQAKRYLLRLINTSFSTTFVFSIDNHYLTIVGADFVPVWPSRPKTHVQIGIGQRYTVVVEAVPQKWAPRPDHPPNKNFWIRTSIVPCFKTTAIVIDGHDTLGVMRYDPTDLQMPKSSAWTDLNKDCKDETDLSPRLYWNLTGVIPANSKDSRAKFGQEMSVDSDFETGPKKSFPLGKWAFEPNGTEPDTERPWNPLQIDYDDPFFLHLNELNRTEWKPSWMVIPANYTDKDWVFLAITGMGAKYGRPGKFPAAHPIHLHGHDFALLQVEEELPFNVTNFNFNTKNPLRRDVVLLPGKGWIVIAFKADNPGSWIVHCHIAFHASEGLAFQINERQADANALWPSDPKVPSYDRAISEAKRVCKRWKSFQSDCTQHWPGKNETGKCWPACNTDKPEDMYYACEHPPKSKHYFQDDSGV